MALRVRQCRAVAQGVTFNTHTDTQTTHTPRVPAVPANTRWSCQVSRQRPGTAAHAALSPWAQTAPSSGVRPLAPAGQHLAGRRSWGGSRRGWGRWAACCSAGGGIVPLGGSNKPSATRRCVGRAVGAYLRRFLDAPQRWRPTGRHRSACASAGCSKPS